MARHGFADGRRVRQVGSWAKSGLRVWPRWQRPVALDPKRKLSGTACMKNVLMVTVRLSLI
jgi:hypothetical protein